ncbi:DUF2723 domain-containing protein [bacterium]|nr:DUF2723 domain-containing protein [candidate division CSSED10-310 bacterium]
MSRTERHAPWLVFTLAFVFYCYHLLPTVGFIDAPRYTYKASVLELGIRSIDHPLFILLAHPLAHIPIGNPAWRVNLASAIFGAVTAGLLMLLLQELLQSRFAAATAALASITSWNLWWSSTEAEVYTLNTTFLVVIYWLVLRFLRRRDGRYLAAACLAWGLSLVNHQTMVLLLPAMALLIIGSITRCFLPPRSVVVFAAWFLLGFSMYLILMGRHVCSHGMEAALAAAAGGEFNTRMLVFPGWPAFFQFFLRALAVMLCNFDWIHFMIGFGGFSVLWKRDRMFCGFLGVTMASHALFFTSYQVPDRLFFYLPIYISFVPAIGGGIQRLLAAAANHPRRRLLYMTLVALPVITKPISFANSVDVVGEFLEANKDRMEDVFLPHIHGRDDMQYYVYPGKRLVTAGDWYGDVLAGVPPDTVLVDDWYHGYAILADYFQGVLHMRPDVMVLRWFELFGGTEADKDALEATVRGYIGRRPVCITTTEYPMSTLLERLLRDDTLTIDRCGDLYRLTTRPMVDVPAYPDDKRLHKLQ